MIEGANVYDEESEKWISSSDDDREMAKLVEAIGQINPKPSEKDKAT